MALRKLSTDEKLDAVLEYLNNEYDDFATKPVLYATPPYRKARTDISIGVSFGKSADYIDELPLILKHLTEVEKYIAQVGETYEILYSGKLFIENGGFIKRRWDNKLQNIQTWILTAGSILAGIGTIGLLVFEIWKAVH